MPTLIPILSTILGLALFEVISSVDNAVINAEVLSTLPKSNQRWFVRWGLLFAVLGMRGVLPWLIVWLAVPSAGSLGPFSAASYAGLEASEALRSSSELLLTAAGTALLLIFLFWAVVEHHEKKKSNRLHVLLFVLVACSILAGVVTLYPVMATERAIVIGILMFLVLLLTKLLAAIPKERMSKAASRRAKMVYLEVLDSIFSIEAVLGAFAFTFSVPLILLGNGMGAIIVRYVTATHGQKIRKLLFLKRGAMYALGCLGLIMVVDGQGAQLPSWITFATMGGAMALAYMQH